jgi:hypothetical protein
MLYYQAVQLHHVAMPHVLADALEKISKAFECEAPNILHLSVLGFPSQMMLYSCLPSDAGYQSLSAHVAVHQGKSFLRLLGDSERSYPAKAFTLLSGFLFDVKELPMPAFSPAAHPHPHHHPPSSSPPSRPREPPSWLPAPSTGQLAQSVSQPVACQPA